MRGKWHSLPLSAVFFELGSSPSGLSEKKAAEALAKFGPNKLDEIKKDPWYILFLGQFKSLPIILLLAAAAISFVLGATVDPKKMIDAFAILAAVMIAVSFSFWQEYKAERALEALKKMVVQKTVAMRAGKERLVDSSELVPGDVVILEEGSRVPADMRIIESVNLAADQSTLTGESRPAEKSEGKLAASAVLSAQSNMLFAGTTIVRGHCKGLVVETGMRTEFGKIVGRVAEPEEKETRLQRDISELSRTLGYAGITLAAAFFAIGLVRHEPLADMFVVAVTLAVAVIPEGLPTVLAITLALGVQKMAKENAIVRKMASVETLGSATVICTDKTGTITQNKMTVQEIALPQKTYSISGGGLDRGAIARDPSLAKAVEIMALCNNALKVSEGGRERISGDPTEAALLEAVEACGGDVRKLRQSHPQAGEVPFDSDRKMMSSIRLYGGRRFALVKGAPEKIIPRCSKIFVSGKEAPMGKSWKRKVSSDARSLGQSGMRVLALAYRQIGKLKKYSSANTERSLVFVGLCGMEDPLRPEVPQAISLCKQAGIRVVMITGDSLDTAKAIAAKAGLLSAGQAAMDGSELDGLSDSQLDSRLDKVAVFARVTPEQKYRIVSAFMRRGEVVAVTGDGVNDAPAIKKADIGVAMGIAGTDVSKEVSDLVLTDDNFASIVNAVKYGRSIFSNIKSFVRYQISTNVAALSLMFSAPALGLPLPLNPIQILWINIMIDGPPALALGAEKPASDIMQKPPRNPKVSFVTKNLALSILVLGLTMAAITLAVFGYYLSFEPAKAYTVAFTLFVFLQLFNALNCRSAHQSLFSNFFSNPSIFAAILLCLAIHFAIVYLEPLQDIFKTVPLGMQDFAIITGSSLIIILLEEFKKKFLPSTTAY
ncbi:MAG: calcium-translocating P-type ATPase, PMCA-type [Candidatus Micrarchaeota archaeon]|nr:calcium-translocating P-type ATPase, PMCA-type [Candidatus Micrarchaeota archaeon]